ncbi:succinate dehydrogenase, hydrophobic membrane anchor protein [Piscinibacter sp.]|uniref:succinate dehydrogenase, hydrophobic membrane anchor protein n=1 Tax=Piscinibacter sp. TaxID=1903157 RepID=UPI002D0DA26F|nr:succinate dehydrogenase, hydrophobic membrane anchor protein [Albitalea sp.]HUG23296.1 succinate dehydrogenase, hydrophobic membrane anchor protein [Albitalea sp.]
MEKNYGSKRVVVGAHYGLRDWLSQRITGVLMALFTVALLLQFLWPSYAKDIDGERITDAAGKFVVLTGYDKWAGIFSAQWMKLLTLVVIVSLAYHAWVGMRDVWMDYVQPVGARLMLQVFTIVWLVGCTGWAIQVLWRL